MGKDSKIQNELELQSDKCNKTNTIPTLLEKTIFDQNFRCMIKGCNWKSGMKNNGWNSSPLIVPALLWVCPICAVCCMFVSNIYCVCPSYVDRLSQLCCVFVPPMLCVCLSYVDSLSQATCVFVPAIFCVCLSYVVHLSWQCFVFPSYVLSLSK